MAGFTIDLEGRVKNFNLPKKKPLIPLYEAIVNSIYAIEERQEIEEFEGNIRIEIIREPQEITQIEGIDNSINDIIGFNIIDNGIGLDANNMRSFLQSDSTYRADKGGKGVGRFTWLKAFEKTEVESIFKDSDGTYVKRNFGFSLDHKDIDDRLLEIDGINDNSTTIKLINYHPEYRKNVNKNAETIATKIMQHCMIYLMSAKCPKIVVVDDVKYDINEMFEAKVKKEENSKELLIGNENFTLLHIKVEDSSLKGNKLYLCANDRVVLELDLDKEVVDLDKKIFDEKGFYYVGVLTGGYLDKHVDMNRASFDISENKEDEDVSIQEITDCVRAEIEEYLKEYLSEVREQKDEHIRKYIVDNAPQFMHLLKYMPDSIKKIKPGLSVIRQIKCGLLPQIKNNFLRYAEALQSVLFATISAHCFM